MKYEIVEIKKVIKTILEYTLEAVFPSNIYCICCNNLIDKTRPYSLCDKCVRNLRWANSKTCEKCGKILSEEYDEAKCHDCLENEHIFEKGFSCVEYGMYEKIMLKDFKYHSKPYFADKLAAIMHDRIQSEELTINLIIPVPMNKVKERKRGYNQAKLLAKGIAKRMDISYNDKIIFRERKTKPMNNLTPYERRENVKGAFTLAEGNSKIVEGQTILLVDDIYTTGSTLDECSKILLEKGAKTVYTICFATGANINKKINKVG